MIVRYRNYAKLRNAVPPYGTQINWGHPTSKNLKICVLFNQGFGSLINYADASNPLATKGFSGSDFIVATGSTDGIGGKNSAPSPAGTAGYTITKNLVGNGKSALSFLVKAVPDGGNSGANRVAGLEFSGSSNAVAGVFTTNSPSGNWRVYFNNGGSFFNANIPETGTNKADTLCGTFDSVTARAYLNGFQNSSGALSGPLSNSGVAWDFFTGESSGVIGFGGILYYVYVWDRVLNPTEVLALQYEPFAFFESSKQLKYLLMGANLPTPLSLAAADSANNFSDALPLNSGYARGGVGKFDAFTFLDSISLTGGGPFFSLSFADRLNLQDQFQPFFTSIVISFNDSINNLAESVALFTGIPIMAFDSQQFNWDEVLSVSVYTPIKEMLADSLNNFGDSILTVVKNVPIFVHTADTINLINDAIRFFNLLQIIAGDNFILSDAVQSKFNHLLKIRESLTAFLEQLGINIKDRPAFSDSFTLTDSAGVSLFVNKTIQKGDTLSLSDHVVTSATGTYQETGFLNRVRRYLNDVKNA